MGADRQIKNVFARHNQQIEIDCVIDLARVIKRLPERLASHFFRSLFSFKNQNQKKRVPKERASYAQASKKRLQKRLLRNFPVLGL